MILVGLALAASPEPISPDALRTALTSAGAKRLVVFYTSWCGACKAELARLPGFLAQHVETEFWPVSLDETANVPNAATLLRRFGLPLGWVLSPDPTDVAAVVRDFPNSIPFTLVIDASGQERARFVGTINHATLDTALR